MIMPDRKPLRLWPGVFIAILVLVVRFILPVIRPGAMLYGLLGGIAGWLAIMVWWLLLSRAPWPERLGAVILMPLALYVTRHIVHVSIATGGQGMLLVILAPPVISIAFVVWAAATRHLSDRVRRTTMVATILLASGTWALVRTGGVTGDYDSDLHWRWTMTPEERLMSQSGIAESAKAVVAQPVVQEAAKAPQKPVDVNKGLEAKSISAPATGLPVTRNVFPADEAEAEWPGFRGPRRDDVIPGVRIRTDWSAAPPVVLWRRPIGPGWSSFAVRGDFLYTQEQRGPDEVVACYKVSTGEPVWIHRDAARFYESNGGPGPRGTPTFNNGCVYAFGATGILNKLRANDGAVVWSRNAVSDAGTKIPQWGCASSPLVVDDTVIVYAGKLVAYDTATGKPRWFGQADGVSYSSSQLETIGGVAQVLMLTGAGATGVTPTDGKLLWRHPLGSNILQPAVTAGGDLLVSILGATGGSGVCRIAVAHGPGGWTVAEQWTSTGLKPYFNDFVIHNGYVFGFDGSILSCIDLKDGIRKWKGGRYGNGQIILLPDQDLLLVVSEEGELALVRAVPAQFTELARFPAIEGKTWNHPALIRDILLVRNGEEMAAFRLSLEGR
jgi:outer membrane protein assembly factor BamB